MNIIKAKSNSGKAIFYTFEISALVVGIIYLIFAFYNLSVSSSILSFLSYLASLIFYVLLLYGIGRIIDLLFYKAEQKENIKTETEDKETEEE